MSKWLQNVDIEENFFELNPEFKYIKPFSHLLKEKHGSKAMWSVFLYSDPSSNNQFRRMPDDEKIENIKEYFGGFSVKKYSEYIEAYENQVLSDEAKMLLNWENNLKKIDDYISKQLDALEELSLDEAIKVQKLLKESKPGWDTYMEVKKEFEASEDGGKVVRKGAKESAGERGEF